jgi:hypothetical protein
VLPKIKARLRLEALEEINSNNIASIHYAAYEDKELALQVEARMMMQESRDSNYKSNL